MFQRCAYSKNALQITEFFDFIQEKKGTSGKEVPFFEKP
jgi:hypothetical protein